MASTGSRFGDDGDMRPAAARHVRVWRAWCARIGALLTGDAGRVLRRLAIVAALALALWSGTRLDPFLRAVPGRPAPLAALPAPSRQGSNAHGHRGATATQRVAVAPLPAAAPPADRRIAAGALAPDGLRRRAIFVTTPADDDRAFDPPAPDAALLAPRGLGGPSVGLFDAGALYRLRAPQPLFPHGAAIALSDRFPVVWIRVAAVPEPASWISMTMGLALVGLALRRARRSRSNA